MINNVSDILMTVFLIVAAFALGFTLGMHIMIAMKGIFIPLLFPIPWSPKALKLGARWPISSIA